MKVHFGGRLFLVAAVLGVAAVFAIALLIALGGRSVVAGPGAAPPAAAPTPVGPEWSQVEGHGTGTGLWWLGTTVDQALEVRVNGARALRLEPNATSPNVIEGYSGNAVTTGAYGAAIGGGGASGTTNRVTDNYGTVGGGHNNRAGDDAGTTSEAIHCTVGGGNSNTASAVNATVGGGSTNTAGGAQSTVGGGYNNAASASASYAAVGGGRDNRASASFATVAGGRSNLVSDEYGAVGGGWLNQAGDDAGLTGDKPYATVGGGYDNTASGQYSTVSGGSGGEATGDYATVSGGSGGQAYGDYATLAGGFQNRAYGDYSFAAGRMAWANNDGCFVWGDSTTGGAVECNNNNRFIARASGGVYLYTTIDLSKGAYLAANSGTWASVSSRDVKEDFTPVDGQTVLASLAEVPITTWRYKGEDSSIHHMGPMSQDLYAAFGLGDSDTSITTVDADGVALAAIQGLYQIVQDLQAENADLKARVTALEGGTGAGAASAEPAFPGLSPWWLALLGGVVTAGLVLAQRRRVGGRQ